MTVSFMTRPDCDRSSASETVEAFGKVQVNPVCAPAGFRVRPDSVVPLPALPAPYDTEVSSPVVEL